MIDQEGGMVRRLPTAPPTESPAGMGVAPNVGDVARAQGRSTARVLRAAGFNVDLAPVADVPFDDSSFLGTRAFGMRPSIVARGACGFAAGLRRGGIAATLKHFPGLGRARTNTDQQPTTILASAASLLRDLAAYRRCGDSVALVMLSSAVYPALDPSNPAVLSPAAHGLLESVGFTGLTITDAFDTPAIAARRRAATRAIRAGVDLLLYGQSGRTALAAHDRLLAEARAGRLGHANLIATATRIVAFKHRLTRGRP
jgi:beta-N-acetylhexosaminidase